MFRNAITQSPLTTPEANDYFSNIRGSDYRNDITFLTSLRALLADRLPDGESISITFRASNYTSTQLSSLSIDDAFYHIGVMHWSGNRNMITVHTFRNTSQDSNNAWLEFVNGNFENKFPGWRKVEKVTAFFRKAFTVHCFVNPEIKSTVLFVEEIDMRRLHFLECGIPAFLPWYFDVDKGFSDEELELIRSLREKSSDAYEEIVEKIAQKYDFRTLRVKKLLADFETRYEREECESARMEIRNIITNINTLNDRIAAFLSQKREHEIRLLGLEAKIAQGGGESELMDYFLRNKSLVLKDVDGTAMTFVARSTIDFFDEEMASDMIERDNSYLYSADRGGDLPHDDMKLLLQAIFVDQVLKIQTCAAYSFNMGGSVRALSGYNYGIDGKNRMPNPHIDEYSCMGDYSRYINERLRDHDYIGALDQTVASCKSLNFADSVVMQKFVATVQGKSSRSGKCILLPDGKVVSPADAVKWLHEQQIVEDEGVA